MTLQDVLRQTRANYCLDCGKCTGICPVSRVNPFYSPRSAVERVLTGRIENLIDDNYLWSCLTCRLCTTVCPSDVDYPNFVLAVRSLARQADREGTYAHNAVMQQLMSIMGHDVQQNRTGWVTEDLHTASAGDDFYFVGCLPYFDVVFAYLDVVSTDTARNTVRLLNSIGVTPVVSNDERCCGADLLLNGDEEGFRRLAELNVQTIVASGAKRVIFSCPECYNAFQSDYPRYVGPLPFEVVHLSTLMAEHLDELELGQLDETVTYHDPCRLGRYQSIYDEPRAAITATGAELVEMRNNRAQSLCCGSTGWVNCGSCAKGIQTRRLGQAQETGAQRMITACPKCRIHLSCALKDSDDATVTLEDWTSLLVRAMDQMGRE